MPFDSLPQNDIPSLYWRRREAAYEVWNSIEPCQFRLTRWHCCALGWLANRRADGWHWQRGTPVWVGTNPYTSAAQYFGLTHQQAEDCFGGTAASARLHGRWMMQRITAADLQRTLRALPVTPASNLPPILQTWWQPPQINDLPTVGRHDLYREIAA